MERIPATFTFTHAHRAILTEKRGRQGGSGSVSTSGLFMNSIMSRLRYGYVSMLTALYPTTIDTMTQLCTERRESLECLLTHCIQP